MILEEVELHQICQYEHFVHKFHPGLTGIFGPNGAGKSNFVKMTWASLTGDFSVNAGVKEDNIRWGKPDNDYSAVTSKWLHEGKRFTVRRAIAGTNNYLRKEGGSKELRGTKEINAEIGEILGVSKHLLDFLFVRQWSIFDFLSVIPSKRAATFAKLCEADVAEKAHRALTDQLKLDQILVSNVYDNTEDLRQQITERNGRIRELEDSKAKRQAKILKKSQGQAYENIIKMANQRQLLVKHLGELETHIEELKGRALYIDEELLQATSKLEKQLTSVRSMTKKVEKARRALEDYAKYKKRKSRIEALQATIAVKPLPAPPEPLEYRNYDKQLRELEAVRRVIADHSKVVEVFEDTGVIECPTCKVPTTDLSEHLAQIMSELSVAKRQLPKLVDIVQSCENHRQAHAIWYKQYTSDAARKAAAQEELDALLEDDDKSPVADEASLHKLLADHEEAEEVLRGFQRRYDKAASEESKLTNQLEYLEADKARIQTELKSYPSDPRVADKARVALEDHRNARADLRTIEARISDLVASNTVDEEAIVRIQQLIDRSKEGRKWIEDLEFMRDICHRENLPKLASQRWLENLTVHINQTLEDFDSPFYVEADEDLSFVAIKPSGRRERAERLSGGEMVLLAIAFRFAVNSLIAGKTGMLILDEPTAGVDSGNIDSLTDVLKKVSEATKRNGQQLIIITHDDRLERAFDDIVYIGKAP